MYLWEVLKRFGVGENFLNWVRVLYAAPTARLRVKGELSGPFCLHRGTRQGCPLSPLLFAMALETLAARIRSSPDIVGFRRGSHADVISLYADDTLLYLGDTGESLRAVMSLIDYFGSLSGFSINWDKSVLMPLDPITQPLPDCASTVRVVDCFKYLGIQVSPDPTQYITLNLVPLLQSSLVGGWASQSN